MFREITLLDRQVWIDFYGVMFSPAKLEEARIKTPQIIELTNVTEGALLDVCCGPARFGKEFAKRGFHVSGVDVNDYLIEEAIKTTQGLDCDFYCEDGRYFSIPRQFDLAMNWFTSFGLLHDDEQELQLAANICNHLKPGGKFIIDVLGEEIWEAGYIGNQVYEVGDKTLRMEYDLSECRGSVENRWYVDTPDDKWVYRFKFTVYTQQKLVNLLYKAGFTEVVAYGDVDGRPYDNNANRLIVVGTK